MGFPKEVMAQILGQAVLNQLDREGLEITWKVNAGINP